MSIIWKIDRKGGQKFLCNVSESHWPFPFWRVTLDEKNDCSSPFFYVIYLSNCYYHLFLVIFSLFLSK